jgi:hypothetical protein
MQDGTDALGPGRICGNGGRDVPFGTNRGGSNTATETSTMDNFRRVAFLSGTRATSPQSSSIRTLSRPWDVIRARSARRKAPVLPVP